MNARSHLSGMWAWALCAASGCAPTYEALRGMVAHQPPLPALERVRLECKDHPGAEGCRQIVADLCKDMAREHLLEAEQAMVARDFTGAMSAVRTREPECSAAPGAEAILQFLDRLQVCAAADDRDCEPRFLAELDVGEKTPELILHYHTSRSPLVCEFQLRQASALTASQAQSARPRGRPAPSASSVLAPEALARYRALVRWCAADQRAEARGRILTALAEGKRGRGQLLRTLQTCRAVQADDPGDSALAASCTDLAAELGSRVTRRVQAAQAEKRLGFGLALLALADDLSVPTSIDGSKRESWQAVLTDAWRYSVVLRVASAEPLAPLAALTETALRKQDLGTALVLLPDVPRSPPPRRFELDVRIEAPISSAVHRDHRSATSRYLAGHKEVPNPDYFSAQRACVEARTRSSQCAEDVAQDMTVYSLCEQRNAIAKSDYQACEQQRSLEVANGTYGRYCTDSSSYCMKPSGCDGERRAEASSCGRLAATPPTLTEEVWADHRYTIDIATLSTALRSRVRVRVASRQAVDQVLVAQRQYKDETVDAAPQYNVAGDPLELPGLDRVASDLAAGVASQATSLLGGVHEAECGTVWRRVASLVSARASRVAAIDAALNAEHAGCELTGDLQTKLVSARLSLAEEL